MAYAGRSGRISGTGCGLGIREWSRADVAAGGDSAALFVDCERAGGEDLNAGKCVGGEWMWEIALTAIRNTKAPRLNVAGLLYVEKNLLGAYGLGLGELGDTLGEHGFKVDEGLGEAVDSLLQLVVGHAVFFMQAIEGGLVDLDLLER